MTFEVVHSNNVSELHWCRECSQEYFKNTSATHPASVHKLPSRQRPDTTPCVQVVSHLHTVIYEAFMDRVLTEVRLVAKNECFATQKCPKVVCWENGFLQNEYIYLLPSHTPAGRARMFNDLRRYVGMRARFAKLADAHCTVTVS